VRTLNSNLEHVVSYPINSLISLHLAVPVRYKKTGASITDSNENDTKDYNPAFNHLSFPFGRYLALISTKRHRVKLLSRKTFVAVQYERLLVSVFRSCHDVSIDNHRCAIREGRPNNQVVRGRDGRVAKESQ
jgi:hypothetical protein